MCSRAPLQHCPQLQTCRRAVSIHKISSSRTAAPRIARHSTWAARSPEQTAPTQGAAAALDALQQQQQQHPASSWGLQARQLLPKAAALAAAVAVVSLLAPHAAHAAAAAAAASEEGSLLKSKQWVLKSPSAAAAGRQAGPSCRLSADTAQQHVTWVGVHIHSAHLSGAAACPHSRHKLHAAP